MSDRRIERKILFVEDEVIVALAYERLLRKHGYSILQASSGESAIEAVRKDDSIDLILMDIDLGSGIDGIDASVVILATRSLPIVFLTGH
ncbi:MAG TPA: response regulator, partial [Spirochaetia bacterium]|nr:response regulator [Spirochaetia bacterium]